MAQSNDTFQVPTPAQLDANGEDHRAAIQRTIDNAAKVGGTVQLAAGEYQIDSAAYPDGKHDALFVPSNVTLQGVGAAHNVTLDGKEPYLQKNNDVSTQLTYIGDEHITGVIRTPRKGKYVNAEGEYVDSAAYGTTAVAISNITIDAGEAGNVKSGIYIGQTPSYKGVDTDDKDAVRELTDSALADGKKDNNISISNVEALNASHANINIHELTTNVNLEQIYSHHSRDDGVILDGTYGATVREVVALENGRHGVNITTGSQSIVGESIKAEHNGTDVSKNGNGVTVSSGAKEQRPLTQGLTLKYTYANKNHNNGVYLAETKDVQIVGVQANDNGHQRDDGATRGTGVRVRNSTGYTLGGDQDMDVELTGNASGAELVKDSSNLKQRHAPLKTSQLEQNPMDKALAQFQLDDFLPQKRDDAAAQSVPDAREKDNTPRLA